MSALPGTRARARGYSSTTVALRSRSFPRSLQKKYSNDPKQASEHKRSDQSAEDTPYCPELPSDGSVHLPYSDRARDAHSRKDNDAHYPSSHANSSPGSWEWPAPATRQEGVTSANRTQVAVVSGGERDGATASGAWARRRPCLRVVPSAAATRVRDRMKTTSPAGSPLDGPRRPTNSRPLSGIRPNAWRPEATAGATNEACADSRWN